MPSSANATPAVYSVNGREFVVVAAGGGKSPTGGPGGVYVAFALAGGNAAALIRPNELAALRMDGVARQHRALRAARARHCRAAGAGRDAAARCRRARGAAPGRGGARVRGGIVGATIGITISYYLGRAAGVTVVRTYGHHLHIETEDLDEIRTLFQHSGKWGLMFGYFVPGVRHFTALIAGAANLELVTFATFAYTGALPLERDVHHARPLRGRPLAIHRGHDSHLWLGIRASSILHRRRRRARPPPHAETQVRRQNPGPAPGPRTSTQDAGPSDLIPIVYCCQGARVSEVRPMIRRWRSAWMRVPVLAGVMALSVVAMTSAQRQRGFGGYGGFGMSYEPSDAKRAVRRALHVRPPQVPIGARRATTTAAARLGARLQRSRRQSAENCRLDFSPCIRASMDRTCSRSMTPELFKYPVSYMTEAGFWTLTDKEAASFRSYLEKGGFVIFDDFREPPRGGGGWANFEDNMRRVLPSAQIVDMDPHDPIFHSFFDIDSFDIIPQHYDEGRPVIRGIYQDNDEAQAPDGDHQLQHRRVGLLGILEHRPSACGRRERSLRTRRQLHHLRPDALTRRRSPHVLGSRRASCAPVTHAIPRALPLTGRVRVESESRDVVVSP